MTAEEVYQQVAVHPQAKLSRFVVELGAGGNGGLDLRYPLFRDLHLAGLVVDGDAARMPAIEAALPEANITKVGAWLTPLSSLIVLQTGGAPVDIDYLRVDLGGYDCAVVYSIMKASYKPKILEVAVNPEIPYP